MKKDDKSTLILLGVLLFIAFPGLFFLGVIIYAIYASQKKKGPVKIKRHEKENEYGVIDTTAEIIDSKIIQEDEWTATKEYKR